MPGPKGMSIFKLQFIVLFRIWSKCFQSAFTFSSLEPHRFLHMRGLLPDSGRRPSLWPVSPNRHRGQGSWSRKHPALGHRAEVEFWTREGARLHSRAPGKWDPRAMPCGWGRIRSTLYGRELAVELLRGAKEVRDVEGTGRGRYEERLIAS